MATWQFINHVFKGTEFVIMFINWWTAWPLSSKVLIMPNEINILLFSASFGHDTTTTSKPFSAPFAVYNTKYSFRGRHFMLIHKNMLHIFYPFWSTTYLVNTHLTHPLSIVYWLVSLDWFKSFTGQVDWIGSWLSCGLQY